MANGFQGPPAVDFYGMLSGLGDTIAKNRQDQMKRDAFAAATTPGPDGQIDYGKAMLGLASVDPHAASLMAQAQAHKDALAQHTADQAIAERHFQANYGLQKQAASRAQYEFDNTPDQYVPNPKAGQPGEPQFVDQYAAATAASANAKPYPVETLGGTKFMVPKPGGGFTLLDPQTLAAPQFAAAAQPSAAVAPAGPPPVASAPGSFSDRFGGAYPRTSNADPSAPVTPVAAAAPASAPTADLNAVDPNTGRREAWLASQSPDAQAYIKKMADYEIDPRTSSTKGGHREMIMRAIAQYDPTYDQNNFSARAKAMRDFSTGTQGNAIRSFDVAIDHLDTLQKYSDALKSGDTRLINRIRNEWLANTGSPLPTNVQAVAPIVGAEVSKAIIGSNNALADREELRKPLQIANSPEQISGAIQGYKTLMAGQLKGLKKQYEDTTGKKDFNSRVRDNTRNILLGGEGGSGVVNDPSQGNLTGNVTSTGIKWSIQ